MFSRKIRGDLELRRTIPRFAPEVFRLADANRAYLREWLPWLDANLSEADTRAHQQGLIEAFARNEAVHCAIFHSGRIVGVAGFNSVEPLWHHGGSCGLWHVRLGLPLNGHPKK
jgi:ribosomal-protein-serine acetyltransferase